MNIYARISFLSFPILSFFFFGGFSYNTAATTPTATATMPPWTFMATAALPVGAEVDCEAAEALEVVLARLLVDPVVVADPVLEALLEPVVVSDEESVELLAVPEVVAVLLPLLVLPVMDAVEADPVEVPVAPVMPKLGEKFMLVASVSSMISMVYWNELTSAASGIWRVALPMEAGIPAAMLLEMWTTWSTSNVSG